VLAGTERFRILEEIRPGPESGYRLARVELLDDALESRDASRVTALRARVAELVMELIRRTAPRRADDLPADFLRDLDDAPFVNALCNALAFDPPEKQGLLEAATIPLRYQRLAELLTFRMAELGASGTPRSGSLH
jgi:Lon protease-like protein